MSEMVISGTRPRNVGWMRAAALLYGDWGTSKAYVIGLAVLLAGYAAPYYLAGIIGLTILVGCNYVWVCKFFPEGGGVYHAARRHSARLGVVGALLLFAGYVVTASISAYEAYNYFGLGAEAVRWAILTIFGLGVMNAFGPRLAGSVAVYLALPAVLVLLGLSAAGIFSGQEKILESPSQGAWEGWTIFTGMVLALSGVEAVANMTGVMRPDPDSSPDKPSVHHQARKAIGLVMIEVCLITAVLGLMIAGMPKESFLHPESFLRTMANHYIGPNYAWVVGVVVGLLLLSAVNTAIVASVALLFSMAQDGDLPPAFRMLNRQGVPWVPLIAAVVLPVVVLESARGLEALGSLYAIGVTGAIGLNLGSCSLDRSLVMKGWQRAVMTGTALLMAAIWVTIAVTKPQAFLFAAILAGVGLFLREAAQRRGGEKVEEERIVPLGVKEEAKQDLAEDGGRILVAAHGMTASAKFALQEAKLRGARVYFLFVREVKVAAEVVGRLEDDAKALEVIGEMKTGAATEKVALTPVYCTANKASDMIVELAATLGADLVILGGTRRGVLVNLLRGDTVREVSSQLPDEIPLLVVA
ncbi:MAG: universal stress protein [Verrucomicrobia bacterium]|nr:universal stress protein [Verrucomicrobiota bacterium]